MFLKTKKSVLDLVEKEDETLAYILKTINSIYSLTKFKYSYVNNFLKNYNYGKFRRDQTETRKFLDSNKFILEKLEELIELEKKFRSNIGYKKQVFSKEIDNIDEAINKIKRFRHFIKREIKLMLSLQKIDNTTFLDRKKEDNDSQKSYRIMALIAKCINEELKLLNISYSLTTKIDDEIQRLGNRIKNNRRLPIIKSKYYHVSPFIFNVGDNVRPAGPRTHMNMIQVEKAFEAVRRKEFPNKPSRYNCIFVTDNPLTVGLSGVVYAVEVSGTLHKTDQDIFSSASYYLDDIVDYARDYWNGYGDSFPEILVKGSVKILGLADYIKKGDKIEIIIDGLENDEGVLVPKGSEGLIIDYDQFNEDLPFVAKMNEGVSISLPPASFKVIKPKQKVKPHKIINKIIKPVFQIKKKVPVQVLKKIISKPAPVVENAPPEPKSNKELSSVAKVDVRNSKIQNNSKLVLPTSHSSKTINWIILILFLALGALIYFNRIYHFF